MNFRINKLSKDIYDRIAAGEVVERPASIVKELVENAIDAGSKNIFVEIKKGGKQLIDISDDGNGIHPDDIRLVFERHATSKIKNEDDIYSISSLGFRGEALASISAVSNITLTTKRRDDEIGVSATVRASDILEVKNVGVPNGTKIRVSDLFFNTPARHKFMGSNTKEQIAITDLISKLAVSHSEISFRYVADDNLIFTTRGDSNLLNAIGNVYGIQIGKNLITINETNEDISISGYISKPQLTRSNKSMQILFVNGRYVKCDSISETIKHGYSGILPPNRFPMVFLDITVSPFNVDVNIHPSKTEVKFTNKEELMGVLYRGIKTSLRSDSIGNVVSENKINYKYASPAITATSEETQRVRSIEAQNTSEMHASDIESRYSAKSIPGYTSTIVGDRGVRESFNRNNAEMISKMVDEILEVKKKEKDDKLKYSDMGVSMIREGESLYDGLEYIGTLNNTFILFQKNSSLCIIDQHAAHEKILFERFLRQIKDQKVESQIMLIPIRLHLTASEFRQVEPHTERLRKIGIFAETLETSCVIIREMPVILGNTEDIETIKDMILQFAGSDISAILDDVEIPLLENIIRKSCKAAIKANVTLSKNEVVDMLNDLKMLSDPHTCPHGRPIMIEITDRTMRNLFYRS